MVDSVDKTKPVDFFESAVTANQLTQWFEGRLGEQVQTIEHHLLDRALRNCFGYHLLQVGLPEQRPSYANCPVDHKSILTPYRYQSDESLLIGKATEIPVESGALDAVVLQHTLDFSLHPHQVLREATRVLIPRGTLLITGFNPYSLLGMTRYLPVLSRREPSLGNFLSVKRLTDWLTLLEYELELVQYGCHGAPFLSKNESKLSNGLPGGGVYMIAAKKQVVGTRLIKPVWKKEPRPLVSLPVAKASTIVPFPNKRDKK